MKTNSANIKRGFGSLGFLVALGVALAVFSGLMITRPWDTAPRYGIQPGNFASTTGTQPAPSSITDVTMKGLPRQPCDIDWDGDCDARDYDRAVGAQGTCLGDVGYRRFADADRDGCVTEDEVHDAFPNIPVAVDSKPNSSIDTSDWKTYRNEEYGEEYGFELKYPKNFSVNTAPTPDIGVLIENAAMTDHAFIYLVRGFESFQWEDRIVPGVKFFYDQKSQRWILENPYANYDSQAFLGLTDKERAFEKTRALGLTEQGNTIYFLASGDAGYFLALRHL